MEDRLASLADGNHYAKAGDAFLSRLDSLLPVAAISTKDFAYTKRWIPGPTRQKMRLNRNLTPYNDGIMDAMDMPGVRVVAVKGSVRGGKTIAAENKAVKNWTYGPLVNMLWLMQSKDDLNDYVDERVTWMLENHDEVSEKIDWSDSRNGRSRMVVGGALALWRAATLQALRGKAAPFIVCDEVDAYNKRVRKALKTLIEARQLEFGANTLAYFCSHPDAGPTEGIDDIISMGVKHMWWWNCMDCGGSSSPSVGADTRMEWNVSKLLEQRGDMEKVALLDMIEKEARLICPHCGSIIDNKMRLEMSPGGVWLQPHQKLHEGGEVEGDQRVHRTMGFEMHAFMTPFADIGPLARGWSEAWIKFDDTKDDTDLKEQTVKRLGETYQPAAASKRIDDEKVVKARLQSSYAMKTVPAGVLFLTAFVDIQGDRFEVVVIGWDLQMRSWLIDRFPIKQWPGFDTIDPSNRISDYRIIEHAVINQRYLIAGTAQMAEPLYLPIARTMVNAAGGGSGSDGDTPGATTAARKWLAEALSEGRFDSWQVNLFHGNAHKNAEPYGRATPLEFDENGKPYAMQIYQRALNVHKIKSVIALRMQVKDPAAPGRMFIPMETKPRYVKEMVAEKFINDAWTRTGANETWDGYVACEAARFYLDPNRKGLWDTKDPTTGKFMRPIWATPVTRDAVIATPAAMDAKKQSDYYERLAALNGG